MYQVSVMYPNREGVRFDIDYYRTTHMDLVKKLLTPFGLVRTEVLRGVSGGGFGPLPYVCVGVMIFETVDGYEKGMAACGATLRADIPRFTDAAPVRQVSEVLATS